MKYKLRIDKYDFYRISKDIYAKNISESNGKIIFETNEETKEKLLKSKYLVDIISTNKSNNISKIKSSLSYLTALLFFFSIIYINSFRVSKITYNIDTPINEEISAKLENSMKELFFFDFLNINYSTFSKELREEYPMYPWINVEKKTSVVKVNIYSYDDTYISDVSDVSGSIVAKCDGIIESYNIYKGVGNVRINQYVKKGDVLVSGYLNDEKTNLVSAKGKIMGYTYKQYNINVNKNTTQTIVSGKNESYYRVNLFNLN